MQYSILDLAPVPEGSGPADSFRAMIDLAQTAEELGYHRFWLAEHHNMPGIASAATALLIGQVAAATKTIRVGAGGIMLPNHAPYRVAEEFGTLATLFPDRIDLGLGRAPGGDGAVMQALRRGMGADRFPDDVLELIGYLGPRRDDMAVHAHPGEGTNVPVWILGSSLYGASLAAAFGLPYAFASHFAPAELEAARDLYRNRFQPGPWGEKPCFMLAVNLICAPTDEEAQFLRTSAQLAFARLRTGKPGLLPRPVEDIHEHVPAQVLPSVNHALGVAAVGSPETVRRQMDALIEKHRPDEIILTGQIWSPGKRIETIRLAAEALEIRATEAA
ncbi:MsnO8 family LLM class oxidoreductase [Paracoccus sp. S-4012]|uniref:LLM class flavin-dependent oxidoreductase n=1 Tax=Paracoccus sp. S-4012 TaxID=2665648 RepID=UPI0012AF6831|nr:LLM class flavin-dependent oxidoreductase [Paracoccus sp. S-4012]MRX50947.1 MsnO8 family LLM class oxidoreductase [Paracoccus sp. S-4012]